MPPRSAQEPDPEPIRWRSPSCARCRAPARPPRPPPTSCGAVWCTHTDELRCATLLSAGKNPLSTFDRSTPVLLQYDLSQSAATTPKRRRLKRRALDSKQDSVSRAPAARTDLITCSSAISTNSLRTAPRAVHAGRQRVDRGGRGCAHRAGRRRVGGGG